MYICQHATLFMLLVFTSAGRANNIAVQCVSVRVCVNQGDTNQNRCRWRFVILPEDPDIPLKTFSLDSLPGHFSPGQFPSQFASLPTELHSAFSDTKYKLVPGTYLCMFIYY